MHDAAGAVLIVHRECCFVESAFDCNRNPPRRYLSWRYHSQNPQPLEYCEVLDVGIAMLNALAWLHPDPGGAGTTHGDLSSCNVLVRRERSDTMCVLLADFETARVVHRTAPDAVTRARRLQRGTPAFMPPQSDEAAVKADSSFSEGVLFTVRLFCSTCTRAFANHLSVASLLHPGACLREAHRRTEFERVPALQRRDIYSVSMVMWHAMTGRKPFDGCCCHEQVDKQAALNRADPALGTLLPLPGGTPRPLELFLRTLWDVDKANLYPNAQTVRFVPSVADVMVLHGGVSCARWVW